ncbi:MULTISPECIES: AzlC family ABC transporter permease [Natrialba]|uniref:Branched-chain amino acid ABC transporter permease n=1 Tax=Natrialba swarupiae TaxID=2448032 RepID=A0A5D5ANN6_9EURY|nr:MULTISPECIES: AzlC family ABC transporter permease [Natrialba]MWV38484.1 branched-chain amino acid ABC transporter permease [Natrialba sp. INN-245]TYT62623.1 branched-chain amino acid ABC transporter permease [Natrialba swarupiae]
MEYEDFVTGVRDITPAIPPNIPFGMLFGATAVEVGIAPLEAVGMSLFMFAGAGQLAAVDLLRTDTALPIVLITVMVINVRYMIYSASIAPLVRDLSRRWRAVMGYALFDINFAILTSKFQIDGETKESSSRVSNIHRGWYYLGLTVPAVGSFVIATYIGALAGGAIGDGLNLEFAIPLIFIALLAPSIENFGTLMTVIAATVVSVTTVGLPFNTGLLVAIICGVLAGVSVDNYDRIRTRVSP